MTIASDARVQEENASIIPTTAVETTNLAFAEEVLLVNAALKKYFLLIPSIVIFSSRKIPIHQLTSEVIISTVTKATSSAAKSLVKIFRH